MPKTTDEVNRILSNIQRAQSLCNPLHNNIKLWRKLYDFEHYEGSEKVDETRYSDPTYTNTVDLAVGILLGNEMIWHAYGWSPSAKEEKHTSNIEKLIAGTITVNSLRKQYDIPYEVIMNFVRDGMSVIYSIWDTDYQRMRNSIQDFPSKASPDGVISRRVYGENPIRVEVIDPLKVSMLPGGDNRWLCVVREEEMSVFDLEATYEIKLKQFAEFTDIEKMTMMGVFLDYWDKKKVDNKDGTVSFEVRNMTFFDGMPLMENPKLMIGYEDIPYTIGFFKPINRSNPSQWGHGVLSPMITSVQLMEKSINRRQRQVDVYSSLPIVVKSRSGKAISVDPGLGSFLPLGADDDIGLPNWPGNAPDVEKQLEFVRSRIQQSGFSDVMFGAGANQISGYALSQLGDQNRIRLTQPVKHLNLLWSMWARKVLDMVNNFASASALKVYGRMRGQDFAEIVFGQDAREYMIQCEVKPEFPNERVRNHAMAVQVSNILPQRIIMERYLGIEQPDDVREMKLIEMAENHPIMLQYAMISNLKTMADEGDEAAAITLQVVQNQLMQAVNQATGGQPNALGTQSADGQSTPQAQGGLPPGQGELANIQQQLSASPNMQGGI